MPFFSVIVPIYNVEEYLEICIDSVLKQTCQDFELILVDDESPDSCPSICDRYAELDKRIVVIHKKNGGLVSARKTGLSRSKGKYILNVDSDDYIQENLLEKLYSVIKENNFPDVIAFDYQAVDMDGTTIENVSNIASEGSYQGDQVLALRERLLHNTKANNFYNTGDIILSIWSKAFKRSYLYEYQMSVPEGIRNGEDVAVVIPCIANAKSVSIIRYVGYYYRSRSTSMVHVFNPGEMKNFSVLFSYLSSCKIKSMEMNILGYAFREITIQLIRACKAMQSYKEFRKYVGIAINDEMKSIIKEYNNRYLFVKGKITSQIMKVGLWYPFYLIYCNKQNTNK